MWTDPPGATPSAFQLVNDLDLSVRCVHTDDVVYPNGFGMRGCVRDRMSSADHVNNVEIVDLTQQQMESCLGANPDRRVVVRVGKTTLVSNQVGEREVG